MTPNEMLHALKEPFPVDVIHWRVGATNAKTVNDPKDLKGIALAYIDARDVMKRLDEVCGIDGWQCKYLVEGNVAVCELSLRINGEWITKSDGAGETDYEGEKGKLSDAFKRAAVRFGVGRYLYYLPNEWVSIKPAGNSYKIISTPNLPTWAKPGKHRWKAGEAAEIYQQVIDLMLAGDGEGIKQIMGENSNDIDNQMKFWALFNSTERDTIKKLTE